MDNITSSSEIRALSSHSLEDQVERSETIPLPHSPPYLHLFITDLLSMILKYSTLYETSKLRETCSTLCDRIHQTMTYEVEGKKFMNGLIGQVPRWLDTQSSRDLMIYRAIRKGKIDPAAFPNSKAVALVAMKMRRLSLKNLSDELKDDFDVVHTAVQLRGRSIRFASSDKQHHPAIVEAALLQNKAATKFLSPKGKAKGFFKNFTSLKAMKQNLFLRLRFHVSPELIGLLCLLIVACASIYGVRSSAFHQGC